MEFKPTATTHHVVNYSIEKEKYSKTIEFIAEHSSSFPVINLDIKKLILQ